METLAIQPRLSSSHSHRTLIDLLCKYGHVRRPRPNSVVGIGECRLLGCVPFVSWISHSTGRTYIDHAWVASPTTCAVVWNDTRQMERGGLPKWLSCGELLLHHCMYGNKMSCLPYIPSSASAIFNWQLTAFSADIWEFVIDIPDLSNKLLVPCSLTETLSWTWNR